MKLLREYRAGITMYFYLFTGLFILYFLLFGRFIYGLTTGGFIFMYFTFFFVILTRHIRVMVMWTLGKVMGISTNTKLISLDPQCKPVEDMNFKRLVFFEIMPIVLIMLTYSLITIMLYDKYPDWYYTPVALGTLVLTLQVFYRNMSHIRMAFIHGDCVYRYTPKTLKIFQVIEGYEPVTSFDHILKDDQLKFKKKMKA